MNNKNNVTIAEAYYTAMAAKNITPVEQYLHNNVQLIGPFGKTTGKAAVIETVKKFISYFESLTIRTKVGSENHVVIIYDVKFSEPASNARSASLMIFENGLIKNIELFFDARPFVK